MVTSSPFRRSHSTDRALAAARPRLRGLSHQAAALLSLPAGAWLVLAAPDGKARVSAAVFAAGVFGMFAASAAVHHRRWSAHTTEVLFRLDHTGIYAAIGGTVTPVAVLGLDGWQQAVMLAGVWAVCLAGVLVEWLPFGTPRGVSLTLYMVAGWATIPLVPSLLENTGWDTVGLLLAGGVVYTVGAVIVASRRPDPAPLVFGYHELWHLMVIVAVGLHYLMVGVTLLPLAEG